MLTGGGRAFAQATAPASEETWGQFIVKHQDVLGPFFSGNLDDFFRLGVPVILSMLGWVFVLTMLVGWGVDVLLSRGFSFFYAPAFAQVKRSLIYATGRLFLSIVYTFILVLALFFSLKFSFVFVAAGIAMFLLVAVAFAAQIVWILYLYRTPISISLAFYIVVIVTHAILGLLIARTVLGATAAPMVADFEDKSITPRLQAETQATRQELAAAQAARNATKEKYGELQGQIAQDKADEEQTRKAIEQKKISDIYVYSRIIQARTRGEITVAREQLQAFLAKFPASPIVPRAQQQLSQINDEIALLDSRKKQAEADAAVQTANAKAELLARAGRGEATLSEMRKALIGKTRAQVSALLGTPAETDSNSWGYARQMIVNPVTSEKFWLLVYFFEGTVQSVDYNRHTVVR